MKTLFYNGIIKTMNKNGSEEEALIVKDGIIEKIGSNKDILKYKDECDVLYDLKQHIMLPGFIDSHGHFIGLANHLSHCNISKAKNYHDIVSLLKDYISSNPDKQWIIASFYDHNQLDEHAHPTKELLDQASLTLPIMIIHCSFHMGVINSKAIELLELDDHIENPKGGIFGKSNGMLNGYLEENAFLQCQNKIPTLSSDEMLYYMKKAQAIYAQNGITTIQEGLVNPQLWDLLLQASLNNLLLIDVVAYIDLLHHKDIIHHNKKYLNNYHNHLKIGGYKIFLDGTPQGKTAYMSSPYKGTHHYCGYPLLSDEKVKELYQYAKDHHIQLLAHCNGDKACEQLINAITSIKGAKRPVMIHAQFVTHKQLKQIKDTPLILSFFISHIYYFADIHIQNLGYNKVKNISPVHTTLKYHIPYTFHNDTPVLMPNLLETIQHAMTRKTKKGILLNQKECISFIDALKAITINGAYQYFEENSKGSIEITKRADLVIMDKKGIIQKTIKDGKIIYTKE